MSTPIRNVSDTALWVAIYRAMENERPDAHFRDPYARRLAGERGEAIVNTMPDGMNMAWPMIVRTAVMDEILLREIAAGVTTVLNLAAGLDARPWRMDLPSGLRWIHVDFPDMVRYFRQTMDAETPRCLVEFVEADLREASERERVFRQASGSGPLLVITEGLLVYLQPADVGKLADALATIPEARAWLTDLASPMLLKMMAKRWAPTLEAGHAPFLFGPAEGTAFFEKHGWKEAEFRSSWIESFRLKRTMKFAWLWRLMSFLQPAARREAGKRMSGIVLMHLTPRTASAR